MTNKEITDKEIPNTGFIKLFRDLVNWEWYDDANTFRVFIHCIFKANYIDKKWRGVLIKRGSFITSRDTLSKELKLSHQKIRTSLEKLESTNNITKQTTSLYTLLTVVSYDAFQKNNQEDNKRATSGQPASNQRVTTTKKEKNIKKERIEELFNEFYFQYQNKKARAAAEEKFTKLLQDYEEPEELFNEIMQGLKNFNAEIEFKKTEKKFIAHPSTWLNQKRWLDEYEKPVVKNKYTW